MPSSSSLLRQLSGRDAWKSSSTRWGSGNGYSGGGREGNLRQMEGFKMSIENGEPIMKKRVMVVVDQSSHSKHAMMWALTHLANKGDFLTLLHVLPSAHKASEGASPESSSSSFPPSLPSSLAALCKASRPEVEIEALVIRGPKFETVMSQVKKLQASVLVLGQKKPSLLLNCICGTNGTEEELVERCINNAECLTIGVRKQSKDIGGYLVSTRWQKNFWLLA